MKSLDQIMDALRAAAEPTRLRILMLAAEGDLTVSELVRVLGQSQPRISRHLKVLTNGGLLSRTPEGSWVFYRLATGRLSETARTLASLAPADDPVLAEDRQRLARIKQERAKDAQAYFDRNAHQWDELRSLHVDDAQVEDAIQEVLPSGQIGRLLDIGTGTGRMLELLSARIDEGHGVDISREMLAVARANLDRARLTHCQVRHANLERLPFEDESFDAITVHQVLHFLDDPFAAIETAADALKPGGSLLLIDFAPHSEESLRLQHQHRRLGFFDDEVRSWCEDAGLTLSRIKALPGEPLTVCLWCATKPKPQAPLSPVAYGTSDRKESYS